MTSHMGDWIVVARDEKIQGVHVVHVRANTIKRAYEKCICACLQNDWGFPDGMTAVELETQAKKQPGHGQWLCHVFDKRPRAGSFNGFHHLFETAPSAEEGPEPETQEEHLPA